MKGELPVNWPWIPIQNAFGVAFGAQSPVHKIILDMMA